MTISKDLYLAILSMDAYNRGYGSGIADGGAGNTDAVGGRSHHQSKVAISPPVG